MGICAVNLHSKKNKIYADFIVIKTSIKLELFRFITPQNQANNESKKLFDVDIQLIQGAISLWFLI